MSAKVVVPDSIISSAASRVPTRTNSGDTVLASAGKDVLLQPVHQRQVVGQPAEHHHRRVRVGVDQPGQHDLVARVDRLAPPDSCAAIAAGRVDVDDVACRRSRRRRASGSARVAFSVTTVPPVTTSDTGRRACAPSDTAATAHTISTRLMTSDSTRPAVRQVPRPPIPSCIVTPCRSTSSTTRSCTTRWSRCATRRRRPKHSGGPRRASACCSPPRRCATSPTDAT